MPGVASKLNMPRVEGGEEGEVRSKGLAIQLDHVVSLILQNLANKDLTNARLFNSLWKQEVDRLLTARIKSSWIKFSVYEPNVLSEIKGIPVIEATFRGLTQTPKPFVLKARLPKGMISATNPFPTRSLKISGGERFIPQRMRGYDSRPKHINDLLSPFGQNLSSLIIHKLILYPCMLAELLSLTPNLQALKFTCVTFKTEQTPDFENNFVLPPLIFLTTLTLSNNYDVAKTISCNFWILKSYAGQVKDLLIDAVKFCPNYFSMDPVERPSLSMGKLERLLIHAPSYSFIRMLQAKNLTFLGINMSQPICEFDAKPACQVSLNNIFEFLDKFAKTLSHLELKTLWYSELLYQNFGELQNRPKVDFPVLTKFALQFPILHEQRFYRSTIGVKLMVSKFEKLEEFRLLKTESNFTFEMQNRGVQIVRRFVERECYWDHSPAMQNIWVEIEGLDDEWLLQHGRYRAWNKEEWNTWERAVQEMVQLDD